MHTLAVVHLDTTAGAIRISVSEGVDGTLIAERVGAEWPFVFPVEVGKVLSSEESFSHDIGQLIQSAVEEVGTIAEIKASMPIELQQVYDGPIEQERVVHPSAH